MTTFLDDLAAAAIRCELLSRHDALRVLDGADELLDVVAAAGRGRRHYFGNRVKLNTIINMKSGLCREDSGYCSQRLGSASEVLKDSCVDPGEAPAVGDPAGRRRAAR